jgi:hypothetical protein
MIIFMHPRPFFLGLLKVYYSKSCILKTFVEAEFQNYDPKWVMLGDVHPCLETRRPECTPNAKSLGTTHFSIEHLSYTLGKPCILGAFAEAEFQNS